jgi:hypothetical protein
MSKRQEFIILLGIAIFSGTIMFIHMWTTDQQRGKVPVNCVAVLEYEDCDWVTPERVMRR